MCLLQKCVRSIIPFILVQLMQIPMASAGDTKLNIPISNRRRSAGDSQKDSQRHQPNVRPSYEPWFLSFPMPLLVPMPFSLYSPQHHSAYRNYSGQLLASSASPSSSSFVDPQHRRVGRRRTSPAENIPSQSANVTPIRNPTDGKELNTSMRTRKKSMWVNFSKFISRRISKWKDVYKTVRFRSELSGNEDEKEKEQAVKVELQRGPFANGMQGQVYYGMFKRNNHKDEKMESVAVKLIGRDTYKIPKVQLVYLTDEVVIEDPKNEIKILQKLHEDGGRRHIIKLYDGGLLEFDNDEAKAKSPFRYVVIQELGSQNLMDAFIEYRRQNPEIKENEIIAFLKEAAQVLVEIHEVAIHMDFKAENLIYVEEKVAAKRLLGGNKKISNSIGQHGELKKSASQMDKGKFEIQQKSSQKMKEIMPADDEKKKVESPRQIEMEKIEENADEKAKGVNKKTRVLKAIDFGGSILLPSISCNSNSRERPEKLRKMTSTPHILPPEFDRHWLDYCHENLSHQQRENEAAVAEENKKKTNVELKHKGEITEEENDNVNNYENIANMAIDLSATTKSDSWQFGVLIYALALIDPPIPMPTLAEELKSWKKENTKELSKINYLYKYLNGTPEKSREEWLNSTFNDVSEYMRIFEKILHFRSQNPRLFLLAHNLMHKDDNNRLSAQGILDYLDKKCQLYAEISLAQNLFIGPLKMDVVIRMHGAEHASLIESGNVSLMQMHQETQTDQQNSQECNKDFKPGEKRSISTFDKLKRLLG